MENKEFWIILIMSAASAGIAVGAGSGLAVLAAGIIGFIIYEIATGMRLKSDQKKFAHLDGKYKIRLVSSSRVGEMIADITYRGAFEGSFDIDKIYKNERPALDLWKSLSRSEQRDIHKEIQEYFWGMRGEEPRISKIY